VAGQARLLRVSTACNGSVIVTAGSRLAPARRFAQAPGPGQL